MYTILNWSIPSNSSSSIEIAARFYHNVHIQYHKTPPVPLNCLPNKPANLRGPCNNISIPISRLDWTENASKRSHSHLHFTEVTLGGDRYLLGIGWLTAQGEEPNALSTMGKQLGEEKNPYLFVKASHMTKKKNRCSTCKKFGNITNL